MTTAKAACQIGDLTAGTQYIDTDGETTLVLDTSDEIDGYTKVANLTTGVVKTVNNSVKLVQKARGLTVCPKLNGFILGETVMEYYAKLYEDGQYIVHRPGPNGLVCGAAGPNTASGGFSWMIWNGGLSSNPTHRGKSPTLAECVYEMLKKFHSLT